MNFIILLCALGMAYSFFLSFRSHELTFTQLVANEAVVFLGYKALKSRLVQGLLYRFFGWDPVSPELDRMREDTKRDFAAWQRQQAAKRQAEEQRARERFEAENKRIYHQNMADRYKGTYDGYRHQNQANKYRDDAK